jgi:hypothetical protein
MTTRLHCCVPFCRRTTRNDKGFSEWICGRHWRAVGHREKWLHRRAKRMLRVGRAGWTAEEIAAFAARAWERCKRHAIEKAVGI